MFRAVLAANRGAIACRIFRTLRRMGVRSVAIYSEADSDSLHLDAADDRICVGPALAKSSYLNIPAILDAARQSGAEAIHPGYGFLSENAAFAEACEAAGIRFIGPRPEQMRAFGLKHSARALAEEYDVPLLPGSPLLHDVREAFAHADRVGYPVILKSTAGGGGIGMKVCRNLRELGSAYESVAWLGQANFGQSGVYLEKFIEQARHIEVQIFGDGQKVVALGERDCSAQRRNQKVIEETPGPGLDPAKREALCAAAIRLAEAVRYESAGTVEFLYDAAAGEFYFLEVNTRLQVEHGVTEEVTGVDLVEWMIRHAAGEPVIRPVRAQGHSIQARIYAENALLNFQPAAGQLTEAAWPAACRVETWVENGTNVSPYYDPLLGKIIVHGSDRADALNKLEAALQETRISGLESNLDYLRTVIRDPGFRQGSYTTSLLNQIAYQPRAFEVVEAGAQTTVQDYPGRLGYWEIGVPPSGPMDSHAFQLANRLVGNAAGAPALECTAAGPKLKFHAAAVLAVTGADMDARLDSIPVPRWTAFSVKPGQTLSLGFVQGAGQRTYVAIQGGIDVPAYLGSKSTFILGKFGGHGGRVLQPGDVLRFGELAGEPVRLQPSEIPAYQSHWEIQVMYGPHGAPDFFTPDDIEMLFSTNWEVHHNSDRTGVRLIGPKPHWARPDGGEAGLHPSNLHDNAYAIGAVDFTGDMPILLGPDGPSLGGFVCPATIVTRDLWKMGQLKAGDTVRLVPESLEGPVIRQRHDRVCRADGDANLLIEFGPMALDFGLRLRVHELTEALRVSQLPGLIDLTPGIRSLQVHYDPRKLSREELLDALDRIEDQLPDPEHHAIPSRIVHLPLSWDDPATRLAIERYLQTVRPDAPWGPSNIEFIRRINQLDSVEDVYRIVYGASYLVLGLGDVYLGAPVATPLDPRHRLVTTKYNPARTWTPENAVGIGGAYLCVYGMEGPGGYQFVGRTLQMWNTWRAFDGGKPWLLRCFDQIRFHPVSAKELLEIRQEFPRGRYPVRIEPAEFSLRKHHAFLDQINGAAKYFKQRQEAAFQEERARWAAAGYSGEPMERAGGGGQPEGTLAPGEQAITSPMTASVWSVDLDVGQEVNAGDRVLVLEAMKMAVNVAAPARGRVRDVFCQPGDVVRAGQMLAVLEGIDEGID
jgi:urea carboxylase